MDSVEDFLNIKIGREGGHILQGRPKVKIVSSHDEPVTERGVAS